MFDKHYDHWSEFPMELWRWKNFTPQEIACKDGAGRSKKSLKVNEKAMDALQHLRDLLGVPIKITSAYRTPEYNKRIGGARNSQHVKAKAFDIVLTEQVNPSILLAAAEICGFKGIGFYKTFMHVDVRTRKARWGKRTFPLWEGPITPVRKTNNVSGKPLHKSRTAFGSGTAALGGTGILLQEVTNVTAKIEQQQSNINSGNIVMMLIGTVVIVGALIALYARWDDAGKPLPKFLR